MSKLLVSNQTKGSFAMDQKISAQPRNMISGGAIVPSTKRNCVGLTVGTFLTAILTLSACGPSQTSAARDDAQINANYAFRQNQLRPLAGLYYGTLTKANGPTYVSLNLSLASIETSVPGRGTTQSVATLAGSFNQCISSEEAPSCSLQIVNFSDVTYTQASSSGNKDSLAIQGTIPNQTGTAAPAAYLDLRVQGKHITGSWNTSGNYVGQLDLVKQD